MRLAFIIGVVLVLLFSAESNAQSTSSAFAVVELFTSQSDVNGPPAGRVLKELEQMFKGKNVYFLEYHVDYWNKSGWKDPYSRNQFTMRQENYSRILPNRDLYTPQLIVNGEKEMTGTEKQQAAELITGVLSKQAAVQVTIQSDSIAHDTLYVSYKTSSTNKNYAFRVALTQHGLSNAIASGANKGAVVYQGPVVRRMTSVSITKTEGTIKVPLNGFVPDVRCRITGFVQHKQTMKILGAASIGVVD
jgi:hypothetical protein